MIAFWITIATLPLVAWVGAQHLLYWRRLRDAHPILSRQERITTPAIAHNDSRGSIINILQGKFSHAAIITCEAGSVRARHWHPKGNTQFMYLLSGSYLAVSQEVDRKGRLVPGTRREQIISAGELAECPARLAHAYKFLEPSTFINFNTQERAPDGYGKHTIPIELNP